MPSTSESSHSSAYSSRKLWSWASSNTRERSTAETPVLLARALPCEPPDQERASPGPELPALPPERSRRMEDCRAVSGEAPTSEVLAAGRSASASRSEARTAAGAGRVPSNKSDSKLRSPTRSANKHRIRLSSSPDPNCDDEDACPARTGFPSCGRRRPIILTIARPAAIAERGRQRDAGARVVAAPPLTVEEDEEGGGGVDSLEMAGLLRRARKSTIVGGNDMRQRRVCIVASGSLTSDSSGDSRESSSVMPNGAANAQYTIASRH